MTTPFLGPRRLYSKAIQLGIKPETTNYQEKSRLFHDTIGGIADELYSKETSSIAKAKDFLKVLETDLREISAEMRKFERDSHKDFAETRKYLDKAYQSLSLAISLFDDKEERDAVKRINARIAAILKMRNFLDKAILQWPP